MSDLTDLARRFMHDVGLENGIVADVVDALDAAEAKLAAIDGLHFPTTNAYFGFDCPHCQHVWPCPTHRILHPEADA